MLVGWIEIDETNGSLENGFEEFGHAFAICRFAGSGGTNDELSVGHGGDCDVM